MSIFLTRLMHFMASLLASHMSALVLCYTLLRYTSVHGENAVLSFTNLKIPDSKYNRINV